MWKNFWRDSHSYTHVKKRVLHNFRMARHHGIYSTRQPDTLVSRLQHQTNLSYRKQNPEVFIYREEGYYCINPGTVWWNWICIRKTKNETFLCRWQLLSECIGTRKPPQRRLNNHSGTDICIKDYFIACCNCIPKNGWGLFYDQITIFQFATR